MEHKVIEINGSVGHFYIITNSSERYYSREFAERACDLLNFNMLSQECESKINDLDRDNGDSCGRA